MTSWRPALWIVSVIALLLVACGGAAPTAAPTESDEADEADEAAEDTEPDPDPVPEPEEPDSGEVAAPAPTVEDDPNDADSTDEDGAGGDEEQAEDPSSASGSASSSSASVSGDLEIHFIDVGQADATLLLHDEVAILIDAGGWQGSQVVPYLRAAGVDALDLVVITHPHADHIGQFDQVMDAFDVAEVWWSGSTTTTQTFGRALSALERSSAAYEEPRAGASTAIGPLAIDVVNPPAGVGLADLHDASLSLRIAYGEVTALFTGDAEAATEARMVASASAQLDADILQVGHHGSSTSTTPGFLAAVDPAVAVYSAGSGNSYGHPHAEVVDRLTAAGSELYGTDVHGTVVITTDGAGLSVTTSSSGTPVAGSGSSGGSSGSSGSSSAGSGSSGSGGSEAAPEQPSAGSGGTSAGCGSGKVDINSAGFEQLQDIIHIGPDRAEQIIALRPFASVQTLDRVSGIAAGRLTDILAEGIACAS